MIISSTGFINICKIQQIEIKFFPYLVSLVGMIVKHTYKRVKKKKRSMIVTMMTIQHIGL